MREPPPDRDWAEFEYRREVPNVGVLLIGVIGICLGIIALVLVIGML